MWPDTETDRDYLTFTGVAESVAETVVPVCRIWATLALRQ
jgi:hypothetical protein